MHRAVNWSKQIKEVNWVSQVKRTLQRLLSSGLSDVKIDSAVFSLLSVCVGSDGNSPKSENDMLGPPLDQMWSLVSAGRLQGVSVQTYISNKLEKH